MYSRTSLLLRQVHNESTTIRQIHCKSATSCTTHPQHIEVIEFFFWGGLSGRGRRLVFAGRRRRRRWRPAAGAEPETAGA